VFAPVCADGPSAGTDVLVIVIFIALFLLAVMGLATDYTQVWARRQMAKELQMPPARPVQQMSS